MKKLPPVADAKPDFFSTQVSQASRFYLNLNPARNLPLAIVSGGCERCATDYAIHRATFPFYSLEFVAQGVGAVKLNQAEHGLQPGSVFAYGPGIAQDITTNPLQPLFKYFVDFTGTEAAKLLTAAKLKPGTISSVFPPGEIQPLFDELIRNGRRNTAGTHAICTLLLRTLILKIADARAPLPGQNTQAFATYQHCRQHITQNFLRLRSVEQVAAECHLDDAYLCRLFKRYDNQSPYRLLIRLKMNHAAERLQLPGGMVKQAAEETGFTNQFHFSRVFKSVFGLSPSAMLKMR
jgi:AraC-like DNA-binding protein